MKLAIEAVMRSDGPTAGVRPVRAKSAGYHTWTEAEIAMLETAYPVASRARLAFALLLYTGQRRGDAVGMGRQHIRDGRILLRQQKKGTVLAVPIHPHLKSVLDMHQLDNLTSLATSFGKSFTPAGFGNGFREQCDEAGLPHSSVHERR